MFSLIGKVLGTAVGTIAGIAIAPLAIALGITEEMVKEAMRAGCSTVEEIKKFYSLDD